MNILKTDKIMSPALFKEDKFNDVMEHLRKQISTIEENIDKYNNDEQLKNVIDKSQD